jgi:tetratricopeptide (TPR) repeat protein
LFVGPGDAPEEDEMTGQPPEDSIEELRQRVKQLYGWGKHREARELAVLACERTGNLLGVDHLDTARSCNEVAYLLRAVGDPAAALPYHERALTIYRRQLGDDHLQTARSLDNVGAVLREMGEPAAARPHLEQALAIRRRQLGQDHLQTAGSLTVLGSVLLEMGDRVAARPHLEQALAIRRQALGDDHTDLAPDFRRLGGLLLDMGDLAEARPCLEQALEIQRRVLAAAESSQKAMGLVAGLLSATGVPGAGVLGDLVTPELGSLYLTTGTDLRSLGSLLLDLGDLAAARPCLEQALEYFHVALGPDHPDNAATFIIVGILEVASRRLDEAVGLMRQAATAHDRTISDVFAVSADQQRLHLLEQLKGAQGMFLSLVNRHLSHSPDAVGRVLDLVLRRKALGAEALAAQRDAILGFVSKRNSRT